MLQFIEKFIRKSKQDIYHTGHMNRQFLEKQKGLKLLWIEIDL